jgi:opacity protein-like surface antigen
MKNFLTLTMLALATTGLEVAKANEFRDNYSANDKRLYAGAKLGHSTIDDMDFNRSNLNGELMFDSASYSYSVFFGGYIANNLRLELELAKRTHDANGFNSSDEVASTASGDYEIFTAMFNAYYDFDGLANDWRPYIGLGIGSLNIDSSLEIQSGGKIKTIPSNDEGGAAQIMLGVTYDITSNIALISEYKKVLIPYKEYLKGGDYDEFNLGVLYKF